MNQSLKSIIALIILVCLGASFLGFQTNGHSSSKLWMELSGLISIPCIAILYWADFRKDKEADYLSRITKTYFEQNGLCFAIAPAVDGTQFFWKIYFQNRFTKPCNGKIALRPAVRSFMLTRPKIDEIFTSIECDGSGFGTLDVPCLIPEQYQGKTLAYEVVANVHYPEGKGEMIRFREGLRVGNAFKNISDSFLTVLLGMCLVFYANKPATFKVRLPHIKFG